MCVKIVGLFLTAEFDSDYGILDYNYGNTDALVHIEEEDRYGIKRIKKYIATFFTYNSILEMKTDHDKSGEYLKGKYFFLKNMVLIDNCSKESINEVINNLIDEGDFNDVFKRL